MLQSLPNLRLAARLSHFNLNKSWPGECLIVSQLWDAAAPSLGCFPGACRTGPDSHPTLRDTHKWTATIFRRCWENINKWWIVQFQIGKYGSMGKSSLEDWYSSQSLFMFCWILQHWNRVQIQYVGIPIEDLDHLACICLSAGTLMWSSWLRSSRSPQFCVDQHSRGQPQPTCCWTGRSTQGPNSYNIV